MITYRKYEEFVTNLGEGCKILSGNRISVSERSLYLSFIYTKKEITYIGTVSYVKPLDELVFEMDSKQTLVLLPSGVNSRIEVIPKNILSILYFTQVFKIEKERKLINCAINDKMIAYTTGTEINLILETRRNGMYNDSNWLLFKTTSAGYEITNSDLPHPKDYLKNTLPSPILELLNYDLMINYMFDNCINHEFIEEGIYDNRIVKLKMKKWFTDRKIKTSVFTQTFDLSGVKYDTMAVICHKETKQFVKLFTFNIISNKDDVPFDMVDIDEDLTMELYKVKKNKIKSTVIDLIIKKIMETELDNQTLTLSIGASLLVSKQKGLILNSRLDKIININLLNVDRNDAHTLLNEITNIDCLEVMAKKYLK